MIPTNLSSFGFDLGAKHVRESLIFIEAGHRFIQKHSENLDYTPEFEQEYDNALFDVISGLF